VPTRSATKSRVAPGAAGPPASGSSTGNRKICEWIRDIFIALAQYKECRDSAVALAEIEVTLYAVKRNSRRPHTDCFAVIVFQNRGVHGVLQVGTAFLQRT
jgi:hypothetical protein